MKTSTLVNMLMLSTGSLASRLSFEEADAICGDLGVVNATNMPEGTDLDKARTCLEHPLTDFDISTEIKKRSCWNGSKKVGCTRGYCWHSCGHGGQWCWAADGDGTGPWTTCSKDSDCTEYAPCGSGHCKSCGCTC